VCLYPAKVYTHVLIDEKDNETFIKITQKILHDGEVNRARYQIENPDMIATKSRTGDVYVFDRTKFDAMPKENDKFNPTLRLTGHDKEGYGLISTDTPFVIYLSVFIVMV
jgi:histone-binding protein RBBP4